MKLCLVGGLRCVVIRVKCDTNRSRGYGAVGVENGPFVLLWPVAYTTACTTVQAVIIIIIILTLLQAHDAPVILKNSLAIPKLLYLLRTSGTVVIIHC